MNGALGRTLCAKEGAGMSLEEFLQSAREGELEIERMSDMLLRLDARAKRVTAVYRQSGGTKGDGP